METKQQLRTEVKKRKENFFSSHTTQQLLTLSNKILAKVEELPEFRNAEVVLAYFSLVDEVSTHTWVDRWSHEKTILLPKVVGDSLTIHKYSGRDSLSTGSFGILEPVTPCFTDFDEVDFVLVPGVAFDASGNRLGRGRGYYDRLFHELLPPSVMRVGVCFPFQLLPFVPTEPTDVPMHKVVTL
ncbi:MAG: 5-formyltetrahydrofolate cyclo-ligase [Bacteroidaceae bacterium]